MRIKTNKQKTPKRGKFSELLPCILFRCELRMASSHQYIAVGALKDGAVILPRVIWEGFGEEVNVLAELWQTDSCKEL